MLVVLGGVVALGFGVLAAGDTLEAGPSGRWRGFAFPFLAVGYALASPFVLLAQLFGLVSPSLSRKTAVSRAKLKELDGELARVCGARMGHEPRHERVWQHHEEGTTRFWDQERPVAPYRFWNGDLDLALTRLRQLEADAGRDSMWAAFPEHSTIRKDDSS